MKISDLLLCILFPLAWGINTAALKFAVIEISAFEAILLRFVIVAIVLAPFLSREKLHLGWLLATSITISSSILFTTLGVKHLDNLAILIMIFQLNVPMTTILSVVFLNDKVGWQRILGMIMAFAGVCIVVFSPEGGIDIVGVIFVLIAAILTAAFNISLKKLHPQNVMSAIGWSTIISLPLVVIATLLFSDFSISKLEHLNMTTWSAIVFSGLVSTLIGYGIWFYLSSRYKLSLIAPFGLLTPIFATIASIICFDEVLTNIFFIGSGLTFAGITLIIIRKPETAV